VGLAPSAEHPPPPDEQRAIAARVQHSTTVAGPGMKARAQIPTGGGRLRRAAKTEERRFSTASLRSGAARGRRPLGSPRRPRGRVGRACPGQWRRATR